MNLKEDRLKETLLMLSQQIGLRQTGKTRAMLLGPSLNTDVIIPSFRLAKDYREVRQANYIGIMDIYKLAGSRNSIVIDQEVTKQLIDEVLKLLADKNAEIRLLKNQQTETPRYR